MNEKIQDINSILKDLFINATSNNISLNKDMVYSFLIYRDVKPDDLEKKYNFEWNFDGELAGKSDNFFGRWIEKFKNSANMKVFCSEGWKYFCQFIGGNDLQSIECVKLYIPLDYEHLYEGVNEIFSFLDSNNISHCSKVASNIRFDNVVVRLGNLEDARKIQEFIDNNRYIQNGLIKVSSFGFSKNGVGYGYDGNLSYNTCIAKIITNYINSNLDSDIESINFYSFSSFVDSISKNLDNISELGKHPRSDYVYVDDARFIVELLKRNLKTIDFEEYEDLYRTASALKERKIFKPNKSHIVYNDFLDNQYSDEILLQKKIQKREFNKIILFVMENYPLGYDEENPNKSGFDLINELVIEEECDELPEDVNFSYFFNFEEGDILSIIEDNGIVGEDVHQKINNYIKLVMLNEIICCFKVKYGNDGVFYLSEFISCNKLDNILDSDRVKKLMKTLNASQINKFLSDLGIDSIFDYEKHYYNYDMNVNYGRR